MFLIYELLGINTFIYMFYVYFSDINFKYYLDLFVGKQKHRIGPSLYSVISGETSGSESTGSAWNIQ